MTAGRAVECAQALAKASFHPVHVVRGGFQRFSALYPFLRTEKIIYTVTVIKHNTCPGPSYTHHYTCEVHLSLPSGSGLQSSDLDSTLFRLSPYGSHSSEYLLYYYYYSTLLFPQWDKITLTPHNSMNRGILVADWLICIFSNHLDKEICFQYQPEK